MSEDISDLEVTVTKSKAGDFSYELPEDDWLPAVITKIEKFDDPKVQKFGPSFNWTFELEGEKYSFTYEEKKQQRKVTGQTSMTFSPKSKLYKWYSKLMGKEPVEGEKISLKQFVNFKCFVMVKANKQVKQGKERTYYNVDMVKSREGNGVVQTQPVQESTKVVATPPVTVKKEEPSKAQDIFADISDVF